MRRDIHPEEPEARAFESPSPDVKPGPEPLPPDAAPDDPKYHGWPYFDLRGTADRRGQPTPWWASLVGMKRRKSGRRWGEDQNTYVDVYERRDVALVLGIFVLNMADAALTLDHLDRGGSEANPLLAHILDAFGQWGFLYEKALVVGLSVLTLVVHKNFKTARVGMLWMLALYALLSVYHLILRLA